MDDDEVDSDWVPRQLPISRFFMLSTVSFAAHMLSNLPEFLACRLLSSLLSFSKNVWIYIL